MSLVAALRHIGVQYRHLATAAGMQDVGVAEYNDDEHAAVPHMHHVVEHPLIVRRTITGNDEDAQGQYPRQPALAMWWKGPMAFKTRMG